MCGGGVEVGEMKSKEMKEGTYLIMHETGMIQEEIKSSHTRYDQRASVFI